MSATVAILSLALAILTTSATAADWPHPGSKAGESRADFEERMEWWRDARFGMFIHWGPVSLTGREIGWSRQGERRENQEDASHGGGAQRGHLCRLR